MRRALSAGFLAALVTVTIAGCSVSRTGGDAAKNSFLSAADRICATHARTVMDWLVQPRSGNLWQQAAATDEGIYEIISTTIGRLESLGRAPGPDSGAFNGYVSTLRARASLYMLMRIANEKRDDVVLLRFQRRVNQIDSVGDRNAHRYGLQICGTGAKDFAKALLAAGWR